MENSIEEDIETIKYNMKIIKSVMNNFEDELCENMQMKTDEVNKAIEHILSDYKRVLKENEELKNDYENLSNSVVVKNHCIKNSIPVSLVKDKIEELNKKEKKELKGMKGQDRYFVKQTYQNKRMILQELIEEREK